MRRAAAGPGVEEEPALYWEETKILQLERSICPKGLGFVPRRSNPRKTLCTALVQKEGRITHIIISTSSMCPRLLLGTTILDDNSKSKNNIIIKVTFPEAVPAFL